MKQFSWKFTQYAEFNESDSLLLVSGGHFGNVEDASGEVAVFALEGNFTNSTPCIYQILLHRIYQLPLPSIYQKLLPCFYQ